MAWKTFSAFGDQVEAEGTHGPQFGTDGQLLKSGRGRVGGYMLSNLSTLLPVYLRFYDLDRVPTKDDLPKFTLVFGKGIPANLIGDWRGLEFENGIGVRAVSGAAQDDETSPVADSFPATLFYV